MIQKIKDNFALILLLNLFVSALVLITNDGSPDVNLIVINGKTQQGTEKELKKVICQEGFSSIKDKSFSDYYLHPQISKQIQEKNSPDYKLDSVSDFYFKMEGREICRVVAKKDDGFIAFEAVVSSDGPLLYRITSIRSQKPVYKEIKEYL